MIDLISRQDALDTLVHMCRLCEETAVTPNDCTLCYMKTAFDFIESLPSAEPDTNKYEYHYDHTDCIWYRSEARNRCPVTCAQYRDGWNDAMNYVYRDGKGYRPYRRNQRYE